ncbi:hypothetical protein CHU98_g12234 [Xylaria longipes]|nr:hypothetical protein CHU98_g12234 [Xylaria longipes]
MPANQKQAVAQKKQPAAQKANIPQRPIGPQKTTPLQKPNIAQKQTATQQKPNIAQKQTATQQKQTAQQQASRPSSATGNQKVGSAAGGSRASSVSAVGSKLPPIVRSGSNRTDASKPMGAAPLINSSSTMASPARSINLRTPGVTPSVDRPGSVAGAYERELEAIRRLTPLTRLLGTPGMDPKGAVGLVSTKFRKMRENHTRQVLTEKPGTVAMAGLPSSNTSGKRPQGPGPSTDPTAAKRRKLGTSQLNDNGASDTQSEIRPLSRQPWIPQKTGAGLAVARAGPFGSNKSLGSNTTRKIRPAGEVSPDRKFDETKNINLLYKGTAEFVFFFGPQSPLSMDYAATVKLGDNEFPTAEHALQWYKANVWHTPSNTAIQEKILVAPTAEEAKRLGSTVRFGMDWAWGRSAASTAMAVNAAKFMQHPELLMLLMSTGGRTLVYASPTDKDWGIARSGRLFKNIQDTMLSIVAANVVKTENWGRNLLGQSLILVREMILECRDSRTLVARAVDLVRVREEAERAAQEARLEAERLAEEARLEAELADQYAQGLEGGMDGGQSDDGYIANSNEEASNNEDNNDDDDDDLLNAMTTFS